MPTTNKEVVCPECGVINETTFDPAEADLELECECGETIPFSYDEKTGKVEVLEYEDEAGDDDDETEIDVDDDDEDA